MNPESVQAGSGFSIFKNHFSVESAYEDAMFLYNLPIKGIMGKHN